MTFKFKPSLLVKILFFLTGIISLYFSYIYIEWMIFEEANKAMFSSFLDGALKRSFKMDFALNDSKYYMIVAVGELFILIKWLGSFIMFRGKAWGYILYVIPNLILLACMTAFIIMFEPNVNIIGILSGTVAFIIAYTIALIMIIKRRKASRKMLVAE
ncbi:MAG: hypothetical protein A2W93_06560 [Bacteroidetes bacterium GWF2_43_63]|nr:MAG: hypothetical protein A2W94_07975 [Bacteroidetes bacterium GWE2_42_42]OFY53281.1 MAG: hypothetical protein A2W93_06560 [Bacteroidetes bacterium GWF2_43_63]HBG71725.1 hypothetical protein [Bacteroidales bacterium]HCB61610.1 hypothetical protein [Bacteroidales bacterium]HCY22822.1 hypothetical protein [Bacteroidales bacterium]